MKDKLKVPKLRFKEFSGEWEEKKLDDILQLTLRPIKKPSGGYKALGVRSHAKGTFHKEVENSEDVAIDVLYEVRKDDLIINITFAWEHAVAICTEADSGRLVSHRFPTYMAKSNLDIKFMSYLIKQEFFRYNLELISPGGAGRNRVMSKSKFLELSMITPSLPEQQKIADFLSKVDEKIKKLTKKKELLEQYKKGVMQKIFSQEIRFKDDNGNDLPEWEEKELGELCSLITKGTTPSSVGHQFVNEGINFIKIENITQNGLVNISVCPKISIECNEVLKRSQLQCNDILFSIAGTLGRVALVTGEHLPANTNQALAIIRLFNLEFIPFVKAYLSSEFVGRYIDSCTTVGAQPNINLQQINNIEIPFPSLPEQQKISNFLSALDKKIDIASQELAGVQEFKKGLLQQMFV